MKTFFFAIGTILIVLILIIGFTNFASYGPIPFYIFTHFKQVSIMIPVFVGAFLGFLSGACFVHGFHLHLKQIEEDSEFLD